MPLVELLITSIVAGFIGTVFMTMSQEIELRYINKRPISFSPALAVFKIFRFNFEELSYKARVVITYLVHFCYGTFWGFPLALFYFYGYTEPFFLNIVYYAIILLQGWVILLILNIAGPPWTWGTRAVIFEPIDKLMYVLYASGSFMLLLC